jgi:hypothetical protein
MTVLVRAAVQWIGSPKRSKRGLQNGRSRGSSGWPSRRLGLRGRNPLGELSVLILRRGKTRRKVRRLLSVVKKEAHERDQEDDNEEIFHPRNLICLVILR